MNKQVKKYLPFCLTLGILLFDQITKWLTVKFLPIPSGAAYSKSLYILGDFLRFTHVRNTNIAFGIGEGMPPALKVIIFTILPLVVLGLLVVFYIRAKDIKAHQRWVLAAILGGGLGNMIDRIFRSAGVVDFIDVKFYGIFGWPRWPTFNIADASIVVAVLILVITLTIEEIKLKKGLIKKETK